MGRCRGFSAKPRYSWLLPDQIGELGRADGERLPDLNDEAAHRPAPRSPLRAVFPVGIVRSGVF